MIKLEKGEEPKILKDHGATWLKALQDKAAAGEKPTEAEKSRYRHADIKAALCAETHGKCAYCESFLLHIAFGDVEHIIPKSTDFNQTFLWENLTLACDVCNTAKGMSENIVDPYNENPNEIFKFVGPMIFPEPTSDRAVNTERKLRLNRRELLERRSDRLSQISNQLLVISRVQDTELKNTLIIDLETNETGKEKEFSAFIRTFISIMLPNIT